MPAALKQASYLAFQSYYLKGKNYIPTFNKAHSLLEITLYRKNNLLLKHSVIILTVMTF